MINNKEKIEKLVNKEIRRDRLMTDEEIDVLYNKILKLLSEPQEKDKDEVAKIEYRKNLRTTIRGLRV